MASIKERIAFIDNAVRLVNESHQNNLAALKKIRESIQEDCHHEWRHQPDASGGNDSLDICTQCGRQE